MLKEPNQRSYILFKIGFTCLLWIIEIVSRKMETEDWFGNTRDKILFLQLAMQLEERDTQMQK